MIRLFGFCRQSVGHTSVWFGVFAESLKSSGWKSSSTGLYWFALAMPNLTTFWPIRSKIIKSKRQSDQSKQSQREMEKVIISDSKRMWCGIWDLVTNCAKFVGEQEQNNYQPCLLRTRWGRCWISSWEHRGMVSDIICIDWWPYSLFPKFNGKCKK